MRFIIPLTLLLTSLALAVPTADAEPATADAAAVVDDDAAPAPADEANTQWCRKGYDKCMNNCHRSHGGQKCYHVDENADAFARDYPVWWLRDGND
ncbi:hypothetical protein BP00DRAFT_443755 [Aspergillus indologenus CBS 114.80]|uniref:Uncharacterized protein n=1 Tax=Aspergillus indologenus CBS 114.80 TaxID=1450541 RepID=A0A2V5IJQ4_9EURO|nr:hypothetical protein BP00DRAFT_443755 [Aspergillus indologenus CBS 114.80]